MKLITKYSLVNLVTIIILLPAAGIITWLLIDNLLLQQIDKALAASQKNIIEYTRKHNNLPDVSADKNQQVIFTLVHNEPVSRKIVSTLRVNYSRNERIRQLTFPVVAGNRLYKATVIRSQEATEDMLKEIVLAITGICFLLLTILFLINLVLINKTWKPFYATLKRSLKEFSLTATNEVYLPENHIEEFGKLNRLFEDTATRVTREYDELKTFSHDAFQEMQTPLTIILSRLTSLIQSSNHNQVNKLRIIYDVTRRLIEHNERLLLLAKISNRQYDNQNFSSIGLLLEHKLKQLENLMQEKQLKLTYKLEDVSYPINKELVEIMLDSLLRNAIKHNYAGGSVICSLTKWKLAISNTGPPLAFDKANLFKRFPKSDHSDGMGLGLAVIKKICDTTGLSIAYVYADDMHTFNILF